MFANDECTGTLVKCDKYWMLECDTCGQLVRKEDLYFRRWNVIGQHKHVGITPPEYSFSDDEQAHFQALADLGQISDEALSETISFMERYRQPYPGVPTPLSAAPPYRTTIDERKIVIERVPRRSSRL